MKKILFVATISKHLAHFHEPYIGWLRKQGYEVHIAAKRNKEVPECDRFYDLPFERTPYNYGNLKALRMLRQIIQENDYKLIHCHTPMGGVIARLAAKNARKRGTTVIYTAHGFHFYSGAPLLNWLIYYPIEKWLSRYTDCLITINSEDYGRAIKGGFMAKRIKAVHGVGIDIEAFKPASSNVKRKMRMMYGFRGNDILIIYVAELNHNKNQHMIIDAVSKLAKEYPNIRLLLIGNGNMQDKYSEYADRLKIKENVIFFGWRDDIYNLLTISDIAVSASRREGLPVNIMEAMATGKPIVATNVRGNRDLIVDGVNGILIPLDDPRSMARAIDRILKDPEKGRRMGESGRRMVDEYTKKSVLAEMTSIYDRFLN